MKKLVFVTLAQVTLVIGCSTPSTSEPVVRAPVLESKELSQEIAQEKAAKAKQKAQLEARAAQQRLDEINANSAEKARREAAWEAGAADREAARRRAKRSAAAKAGAARRNDDPLAGLDGSPAPRLTADEKRLLERMAGGSARVTPRSKRDVSREQRYRGNLRPTEPAAEPEETDWSREGYAHVEENEFHLAKSEPLSTFSIDVDTASYANTRRFLTRGQRPPASAVRIEEMINYFSYDYAAPRGDDPFSVHTEVTEAPWNKQHRLVHVGIQGKKVDMKNAKASNLVFLLDVSGSMASPDKLPLLQQGLAMLTRNLREKDRVAIVVYAGSSGLVLPSTSGAHQDKILSALERLSAGGSTNGAAGIELAYKVAQQHFIKGGTNRVILATDGDFNVGVSSDGELTRLIEEKRKSGVFLSVLGFGTGNYQDAKMETLADKGNGNYAYIDSLREAQKVLVRQMGGTLITIAKDVKIQIEFNPRTVKSYRLIGYENRVLAARDFNDDKKDAGEIGAGHSVTALYEVVPTGADSPLGASVDPLRYQSQDLSAAAETGELLTLKVRYKQPTGSVSKKLEWRVHDHGKSLANASHNERIAAGIAAFGMLLKGSKHRGNADYQMVKSLIRPTVAADDSGDRAELFHLIQQAEAIGI